MKANFVEFVRIALTPVILAPDTAGLCSLIFSCSMFFCTAGIIKNFSEMIVCQ